MNDLLEGSSPETYRRVGHLIVLALSFVMTRLTIRRIKTSPYSQKKHKMVHEHFEEHKNQLFAGKKLKKHDRLPKGQKKK